MLIVALSASTNIPAKIGGIVLANISSGTGEVNFLSLTHFYGHDGLAGWSSGTGGAGLLGAGVYALATTGLGFSVRSTLLASAVVPLGMVVAYFLLLPLGPLTNAKGTGAAYESVPRDGDEDEDTMNDSRTGLLGDDDHHHSSSAFATKPRPNLLASLRTNFRRTLPLVRPYMLPLFLVYTAEYTLNQGVLPTVLFPLEGTPFNEYRAFYPTYSFIYQAGVFVSRSSLPFLRVRQLYTPATLQVANLALLTIQALTPFIPSVWVVFGIVFWEGLLGGLVYVSTYAAVREEVPEEEREFSLGAVTCTHTRSTLEMGRRGALVRHFSSSLLKLASSAKCCLAVVACLEEVVSGLCVLGCACRNESIVVELVLTGGRTAHIIRLHTKPMERFPNFQKQLSASSVSSILLSVMATIRCEQLDLFKEAKLNHNVYLIMMHYFRVVNDDQAEKMAGDLIVNADLQVLIRARCYLVLAVVTKNAACEASCTLKELSRCLGNQFMVDIEYQACQRCRN
ncbi:battenin CLN3 protein [Elasticomyces elasticus]|nr:battenin CLN3 protein [Elasticomyces elasticus]KAK3627320.1 battenin CLN3 protein [Elasticomyces elasticus]KAK4907595.1 battenin CLN3 protein [Elasticomyces elasticus]KAK5766219.1 battenin CLN3 protein [Elasticomyces elasticus]